jgi:4a-hydroxytetrahydrobiopterin dehydratase
MSELADQRCTSCRGDEAPFDAGEVQRFLRQVSDWEAVDDHHLQKRWTCPDFADALALANRFGEISEEQGHHPVLSLSWGWVEAKIWTHKIDGLTLSDFVLAARFDRATRQR